MFVMCVRAVVFTVCHGFRDHEREFISLLFPTQKKNTTQESQVSDQHKTISSLSRCVSGLRRMIKYFMAWIFECFFTLLFFFFVTVTKYLNSNLSSFGRITLFDKNICFVFKFTLFFFPFFSCRCSCEFNYSARETRYQTNLQFLPQFTRDYTELVLGYDVSFRCFCWI